MGSSNGTEVALNERGRLAQHLASLYAQHSAGALKLAYLLVRDRETAEDLVQEAFMRVAGRLHGLREPDAFGAYLNRTIINLARRRYRKMERERAALSKIAERPFADPDTDSSPVIDALFDLSPRERAVVYFRYYEDLSEDETARTMGCSPGAVKSLTFRAMRHLRKSMTGEER